MIDKDPLKCAIEGAIAKGSLDAVFEECATAIAPLTEKRDTKVIGFALLRLAVLFMIGGGADPKEVAGLTRAAADQVEADNL